MATAGYMYIRECEKKEKKNENQDQVIKKLKNDLTIAYEENELKDRVIEVFIKEVERNDYDRADLHLKKLKELVADWKAN